MITPELLAQIFKINCGTAGVKGTGTFNCTFNINRIATLVFTPQGFEYAQAFSVAYLQQLQQEGKAVVLSKIVAVEDLTAADNQTTETGSNIITTSGKSPYTYAFTFKNGWYFDQAIRTIESFGNYDVTYLDVNLSIICTSTEDVVKGFTLGQIGVDPIKAANGADAAMSRLWLQELYRSEKDVDGTWVTQPNHNIRLASLDGVNDAIVKIETIPADGATSIVFSVKTKADKKDIDLGGLLAADLELRINDVAVVLTAAPTQDSSTKKYTGVFTPALTTNDDVTLRINDSAYTTGIMKKGARLYKSNTDAVVVV